MKLWHEASSILEWQYLEILALGIGIFFFLERTGLSLRTCSGDSLSNLSFDFSN
tara:strand:+ start:334 stop:495 length:162 start_codon:yes stop_codon:yes gene_type:complete